MAPIQGQMASGWRRALHRLEQELGHVENFHALGSAAIGLLSCQAVTEHDPAERATSRNGSLFAAGTAPGQGPNSLGGTVGVDPRTDRLLHPHPGTASSAAERPIP